jgi:hypothetical protein
MLDEIVLLWVLFSAVSQLVGNVITPPPVALNPVPLVEVTDTVTVVPAL